MRQATLKEIVNEYANIFWNGDLQNALAKDDDFRAKRDDDFDLGDALVSKFENQSIEFTCHVRRAKSYDDYISIQSETVFITSANSNTLLFTFYAAIKLDKGQTVPCKPGHIYKFVGTNIRPRFSWSTMNPDHIWGTQGFKNGIPYLGLSLHVDFSSCEQSDSNAYNGEMFGFSGGKQFHEKGLSSPAKSDGMCFIATAAYGVDYNDNLNVLYSFRDNVLLKSYLGKQFVTLYYLTSPPLAKLISNSAWLKKNTRKYFLNPLVTLISKL